MNKFVLPYQGTQEPCDGAVNHKGRLGNLKKLKSTAMDSLFVYGSLGPGRPNEHMMKKIGGTWKRGHVWGRLFEEGWGAQMGFPGIRLGEQVEMIPGYIFCSNNLEAYWEELDDFEGHAYQRIKTVVKLEDSEEQIEAYIYALR